MLTRPVASERLQAVAGRNTQILQPLGGVKIEQLAPSCVFDRLQPADRPILEKRFRVAALERTDQKPILLREWYSVKQYKAGCGPNKANGARRVRRAP